MIKSKEVLFEEWCSEFYDKFTDKESSEILEDQDFESLAIGFFIAKGLTVIESVDFYRTQCVTNSKF